MKKAFSQTVETLAKIVGGAVEGDSNRLISGAASLDQATQEHVSYVESEKQLKLALASHAGCLIIPTGFSLPNRTVIRVRNPKYGFAKALGTLFPVSGGAAGVHPTAVVAEGVILGKNVEIGPNAVIGSGVRIGEKVSIGASCVVGEDCTIGDYSKLHPRVTLYPSTSIGARVTLHSGCVIGADGFGYAFDSGQFHKFPQIGFVEIADDVEVGANTTIDRGALGPTRIGRGTKIDNLVQIAHNVQIGENCAIASLTGISGSAVIEDYVVIAGQVGIGDHARVEKGAILGGQCGVLPHKTVPAGQTMWGTPARPIREQLMQQALAARLAKTSRKKDGN
jgi:UDP-3-O-[3-hydroxymyristoyl] glucosamine N-acyltransferase